MLLVFFKMCILISVVVDVDVGITNYEDNKQKSYLAIARLCILLAMLTM